MKKAMFCYVDITLPCLHSTWRLTPAYLPDHNIMEKVFASIESRYIYPVYWDQTHRSYWYIQGRTVQKLFTEFLNWKIKLSRQSWNDFLPVEKTRKDWEIAVALMETSKYSGNHFI